MRPKSLFPTFACTILLLSGCGGSSGDDPPAGPSQGPMRPGAFSATLAFDPVAQRFKASWDSSSGVDHYRVLLKRTSSGEFEPLAASLSSATAGYDFIAGFNVEWAAATLRVEACNNDGCTAAP